MRGILVGFYKFPPLRLDQLAAAPLHHGKAVTVKGGQGLGGDVRRLFQRLPRHKDPQNAVGFGRDGEFGGVGVSFLLEGDEVIVHGHSGLGLALGNQSGLDVSGAFVSQILAGGNQLADVAVGLEIDDIISINELRARICSALLMLSYKGKLEISDRKVLPL